MSENNKVLEALEARAFKELKSFFQEAKNFLENAKDYSAVSEVFLLRIKALFESGAGVSEALDLLRKAQQIVSCAQDFPSPSEVAEHIERGGKAKELLNFHNSTDLVVWNVMSDLLYALQEGHTMFYFSDGREEQRWEIALLTDRGWHKVPQGSGVCAFAIRP